VYAANHIGSEYGEHHQKDCAGKINGFAASDSCAAANKQQRDVNDPQDEGS
jgi:hypothetical protein